MEYIDDDGIQQMMIMDVNNDANGPNPGPATDNAGASADPGPVPENAGGVGVCLSVFIWTYFKYFLIFLYTVYTGAPGMQEVEDMVVCMELEEDMVVMEKVVVV